MPRNRIIYQSEAVYAGPSPATGFHFGTFAPGIGGNSNDLNNATNLVNQIQRVQTANYSFNVDRTDVNQFGQLAAIDRVILTSPTVSLDFSYSSLYSYFTLKTWLYNLSKGSYTIHFLVATCLHLIFL